MNIEVTNENILKVPFLSEKMKVINKFIDEGNLSKAYSASAALIEVVSILIIERAFNEKVEASEIVLLANKFKNNNEMEIYELLLSLVAKSETIEEIDEYELKYIIRMLNKIVGITLEKYNKVFD